MLLRDSQEFFFLQLQLHYLIVFKLNMWATAFLFEQGKNRDAPLLSETLQNEMHVCETR